MLKLEAGFPKPEIKFRKLEVRSPRDRISTAVFNSLSVFTPDYRAETSVTSLSLLEDEEDAEESGDDGDGVDDEAAGSSGEKETEEGGKKREQHDEFTDRTREDEFSLESNLPADGEQEKDNTSREGGGFCPRIPSV